MNYQLTKINGKSNTEENHAIICYYFIYFAIIFFLLYYLFILLLFYYTSLLSLEAESINSSFFKFLNVIMYLNNTINVEFSKNRWFASINTGNNYL